MWRMAGDTPFGLHGRMFVDKWSLFIGVTLNAGCVSASCQPGLLQLEPTMRIVAIATLHGAFQHFVMERLSELMLDLGVTTKTELRLIHFE